MIPNLRENIFIVRETFNRFRNIMEFVRELESMEKNITPSEQLYAAKLLKELNFETFKRWVTAKRKNF